MTILQALVWGQDQLSSLEIPQLESEVLLAFVLQKERSYLKSHGEVFLEGKDLELYKKCIQKRANHIPIDYIIGVKHWGGLPLCVNEQVLIPRDETEMLAETYIGPYLDQCLSLGARTFRVLDIGTGSGALALWIARRCRDVSSDIWAVDLSLEALAVAKGNAFDCLGSDHGISFVHSDLLANIDSGHHFDLMVANLPYIPQEMSLSQEVQKEPSLALFSGKDGLDHYRRLKEQLKEQEITFDRLYLECLPQQKEALGELWKDHAVQWLEDTGGEERFVCLYGKEKALNL